MNSKLLIVFILKSYMLACEWESGVSLAPSRCRSRISIKKCLHVGGGLRLALPPACVGKPQVGAFESKSDVKMLL